MSASGDTTVPGDTTAPGDVRTPGEAGTSEALGAAGESVAMGRGSGRRVLTLALLDGLVAASFMFFLIAATQPAGLDPPPESAALFLVAATAGVVADRLLRGGSGLGYPATMVAGGAVLVVVAVVVAGTYGPPGPRTNSVGPVAYVALAVAVVVAAGLAWRGDTPREPTTAASPRP